MKIKKFETQTNEQASRTSANVASHGLRLREFYRDALAVVRTEEFPSIPLWQWGWHDFLYRYAWTWFVTLTFGSAIHPEQASKRWVRWVDALQRHPSRRPKLTPVIWARGDELQARGVLHFHSLVGNVLGVPEFAGLRLWERLGGGFARIALYDRSRLGSLYIAKGGDVELSEPFWPRKV